ncbi:MAG: hypothetical protein HIU89_03875 [Proteobacteria bacterium]|nr:hypothetical protein [Pseudomonadota bacterium]
MPRKCVEIELAQTVVFRDRVLLKSARGNIYAWPIKEELARSREDFFLLMARPGDVLRLEVEYRDHHDPHSRFIGEYVISVELPKVTEDKGY